MIKIQLFVENAIQTNCWVLIDEESKEAVIIDLGGGYKKIKEYINAQNAMLKFVICTHGHFDHIMGIPELQEIDSDIPVYLNEGDASLTSKINHWLNMLGLPGDYPPVKVTEFINENTKNLYIGKNKIEVIETPGHTQGGICFKIDNMLFSGDTLFRREIGRCDFPGGDYNTLIKSIKEKIIILPEDIQVYPGHGPVTTVGEEKQLNRYLQ